MVKEKVEDKPKNSDWIKVILILLTVGLFALFLKDKTKEKKVWNKNERDDKK